MVQAEAIIEKVKAYWAKLPAGTPSSVPYVFKFQITQGGAVIKTFVLDVKNRAVSGDGDADVTINIDDSVLVDLFQGKLTVSEAVEQGKLKVTEGDKTLAKKLEPFIEKLRG